MSFSVLPLGYCTNVHPGLSVVEVIAGLEKYTASVATSVDRPIAAGLWLAKPVIDELMADRTRVDELKNKLFDFGLTCYTLNAFPYGNFHSERVKENVYIPDWTTQERLDYTMSCAVVLSDLLPPGTEGSISTVPLGFKGFDHPENFQDLCIDNLLELARQLDDLHDESGKVIRLAIEPEPLCELETTPETITFFERLRNKAIEGQYEAIVERHIGVCYDVCHQSVEFENVAESIKSLVAANIRINKVHVTCAIELPDPEGNAVGREALKHYVEPRYLHQTFAKLPDGSVHHQTDLSREMIETIEAPFSQAKIWRVHFHVPVNAESLGPLGTTRHDLREALETVKDLDYAPHLEVETYTWNVLPGEDSSPDLVAGMTAELKATYDLLDDIQNPDRGFKSLL